MFTSQYILTLKVRILENELIKNNVFALIFHYTGNFQSLHKELNIYEMSLVTTSDVI